jgi:hypothetical protein
MASKLISLETLRSWPLRKLQDLYQNALKHPDGQHYIDLIDKHDLLDRKNRSLDFNDPVYLEILRIAKLDEFGDAAEAAAGRKEPALSGVDKIFRDHFGEKYSDDYQKGTLMSAGFVVADVMRKRGYMEIGTGDCPAGCTARTGLLWTRKSG